MLPTCPVLKMPIVQTPEEDELGAPDELDDGAADELDDGDDELDDGAADELDDGADELDEDGALDELDGAELDELDGALELDDGGLDEELVELLAPELEDDVAPPLQVFVETTYPATGGHPVHGVIQLMRHSAPPIVSSQLPLFFRRTLNSVLSFQ
jgi:hypothetical protein